MKQMYIYLNETHRLEPEAAQQCGALHVLYLFNADEEARSPDQRPAYFMWAVALQTQNKIDSDLRASMLDNLTSCDHYRLVSNVQAKNPLPVPGEHRTLYEASKYLAHHAPNLAEFQRKRESL